MIHIDNIPHLQFDIRAAENKRALKRRPPEHPRPPAPTLVGLHLKKCLKYLGN